MPNYSRNTKVIRLETTKKKILFQKRNSDIGNNAALEEHKKKNDNTEFEAKEAIYDQGLVQFQQDINPSGANDDEDPILLICAWKMNCEKVWEISQEEFMNGFTVNG